MSTENKITIKVIVELRAKPGKRAELRDCLRALWKNMDRANLVF